ncbi:MAG: ABC transporter substrate-binding protein [Acidobacteriota bacterium]
MPGGDAIGHTRRSKTGIHRLAALGALVLVAAALALATCVPRSRGKTLVVAFGDRPTLLDPHMQDRSVSWSVLSSFYDGLVSLTPDLRPQPALASSWEQVTPTRWRFTLRADVRFHDGSSLGAADVEASFRRGAELPASAIRHYLAGIRSVRARDPGTVEIETGGPMPDLLNRLAFVLVVRAGESTARITTPTGTGPYRFVERGADGSILARATKSWHPVPDVEWVRFVFADTGEAAADMLLDGRAQVCSLLPDDFLSDVARTPGLHVVEQPRLAVQMLGFRLDGRHGKARDALGDPRVRRALLLGLNRERLIERNHMGRAMTASQLVHPAVLGFDPGILPLPYDPSEARRLLAEAGFREGFDTMLVWRQGNRALAEAIAADLKSLGVRVAYLDAATHPPEYRDAYLTYLSWACPTGDASELFNKFIRARDETLSIGTGTQDALADRATDLLLASADTARTPDERLRALQQAQRRVMETLPLLPLTIRWAYKGASDRVEIVTRFDQQDRVASYRWRN